MTRTLDQLPSYLRSYCTEHDYSKYTPRDQAAWRYIMRRSHDFFRQHAVSTYMDGFRKSGLRVDRIPHIDEIDAALQAFGWGAVPVVGFIAPWAFIEFQARKILPIASDMRTVEHIAYTPAPDIVHEAAGHAPIIPDKEYSDYLAYYASLGTKAIYSKQDLMLYEAVRYLSDIKEKPESSPATIAAAESRLQEAIKSFSFVSEQARVARMSWWTAEYGLAGSLKNPKIYGAGLLSSVGESKLAMTDKVKKIPLSIDCINYSYNITEPQPQLFVAEDMQHLHAVLRDLDALLAYRIGGLESLAKLREAEAIGTVCLDSEIAISGRLQSYEHRGDRIDFLKFAGPVQISHRQREIAGQGIKRHGEGFSSPIGRLQNRPDQALPTLSDAQLKDLGITKGQRAHLRFVSGFEVRGVVSDMLRKDGKLVIITFQDCTVSKGGTTYFEPAWGEFDMALGDSVPSVYGGPADREPYGEHEIAEPTSTPSRDTPYSSEELEGFKSYQKLRELRDALHKRDGATAKQNLPDLEKLAEDALRRKEWLLSLEIFELAKETKQDSSIIQRLGKDLEARRAPSDEGELIAEGLRLL